jgi:RNA polymerase sigma-70 factor (sigma-E family)
MMQGEMGLSDPQVAVASETGPEFEDFFRLEYPRLVRALYLVTGTRVEAEDLAQEAMARVFERWERLRASQSPEGYLFRVGMNLNRNRLRRLRVAARRTEPPPDPNHSSATSDLHADVMRALRALPIGQRQVLVLTEWLRMSAEEASQILGIKPSSVRARLSRARAAFRERLGGDYG